MLLSPYIRLLRMRTLIAVAFSAGLVLFTFLFLVADGSSFLGVFWHHACNCPVDASELRILFDLPYVFAFVAGALSFPGGMSPQILASNRFLLTRPQSRLQVLLTPFLVSAAITILLPGLVWVLLLGWLHAVHAPSLGHLVADIELIPAASQLGPHPSFWTVAAVAHFGRIYLAGISLGLCILIFLSSSRWLMQSRFTSLKIIGGLSPVAIYVPFIAMGYLPRSLFFIAPKANPFAYVPSTTAIVTHFVFAAASLCLAFWVIHDLEA